MDYVIDHAEDELSEDIIQHLHYILMQDTQNSRLGWFAVGDYKKRPNMVEGHETVKPEEVHEQICDLLARYHGIAKTRRVTLNDIVAFHAEFEYIHPFQDGNGRVGRLIALKECLHYNIVPFIIEESKKMFYYRGLANWKQEKGWLNDTCLDGQDTFKALLDALGIPYDKA
jgi:DNA phosphorothioation-dependent restriction protein DptG